MAMTIRGGNPLLEENRAISGAFDGRENSC
jgi:hypothetical protein